MNIKTAFASAAIFLGSLVSTQADTLNFNELTSGVQPTTVATLSNATLVSGVDGSDPTIGIFSYNTGDFGVAATGGGVCFLDLVAVPFNCTGDGFILFNKEVKNLNFNAAFADVGDSATIFAYNGLSVVGSKSLTHESGNATVDFGNTKITALFLDSTSTEAAEGYAYTAFNFSVVPLPAGGVFLLTGLGAFAIARRRKGKARA
jgi:hypothetical protein